MAEAIEDSAISKAELMEDEPITEDRQHEDKLIREDKEYEDEPNRDSKPSQDDLNVLQGKDEGNLEPNMELPTETPNDSENLQEAELPRVEVRSAGDRPFSKSKDTSIRPNSVLPELTPRTAELGRIPSPSVAEKKEREKRVQMKQSTRPRLPNRMVKLATVAMTSRITRQSTAMRDHATYVDQQRARAQKVVTWDEANNARPPLRIDMDTPGPTLYKPTGKPTREDNSPAWSFGRKTYVEKEGGSRTSWEKTWFQSPHIWQQKADFYSDRRWPAPTYYQLRPTVGRQVTGDMLTYPSYSLGVRRSTQLHKKGTESEPSPTDYDIERSFVSISSKSPSFTHGLRRSGTHIWANQEYSPGPGAYNPNFHRIQTHRPAFSIQGERRQKSHVLGPFSTF